MKRAILLLFVLVCTCAIHAQQNENNLLLGFNLGGGMNTTVYNTPNGIRSCGFGFDAGLQCSYFFNSQIGMSLGVQYNTVSADTRYNTTLVTPGLTHANNPGVVYDLHARFDNWNEHHALGFFSIPVEFLWRMQIHHDWTLVAGLGIQLDMNISGRYTAKEGTFTTSGYFPVFGHEVTEKPQHGFDTYGSDFDREIESLPMTMSLIEDLGVQRPLVDSWSLYLGIYAGWGLNNSAGNTTNPLLQINSSDASQLEYCGTLASDEISALHLLRLGVRVCINFGWDVSGRKKYSPSAITRPRSNNRYDEGKIEEGAKRTRLTQLEDEIGELQGSVDKLRKQIDDLNKKKQWVNDLQEYYAQNNLDTLFAHISKEMARLHAGILGKKSPKSLNDLMTLYECLEILTKPYNSVEINKCLQKLKNVQQCDSKDLVDYLLSVYNDINSEAKNRWMKREERDDKTLFAYVKFLYYFEREYGIDLNKDYPYLSKEVRESIIWSNQE